MDGQDETNALLREIRDLLARQEQQYQNHLEKVEAAYREQLATAEVTRKREVNRLFFVLIALVVALYIISQIWPA